MTLRVVKIGGRPLEDAGWLAGFAAVAARAAGPLVVVHGGGPEISALSERLGIPVSWVGGRRVTPPEALEVAAMVLSGRTNKRVVSALLDAGADALGVSGEDGGLLVAEPVEGGALGRVGRVVSVREKLLRDLMAITGILVISPISRGTDGAPLNVNADDAATAVARALRAEELLFVTDVSGVHDGAVERSELTAEEAAALVANGTARDGMAVKLEAALSAIEAGVPCVRIGSLAMLEDRAAGTAVRAGAGVIA